ncbi:unnamed protein product [Ostreobium quekettii]|uniref:Uncharacterized protein n=1 Tax=Ostreobium quekettii TaxID=121088 RepID=A0A8S1JDE7_9CHLO|nr:unnamed protein product [Ostreobium quekettii]|eukprot:evm.model.scf_368.3 EVM.evm.TU.scf_368.3   scf_368:17278-22985(-)
MSGAVGGMQRFSREDWEDASKEEVLDELARVRAMLEREKRRSGSFAEELRAAKEQSLAVQTMVEQEEEYITNRLMKRLEQLKQEKQILANEVEQEEEFLTNTLQKRLEKITKEKVDLENQLEVEQEYIVNKLQKQLEHLNCEKNKLTKEKIDLENQLEAEQEYIVNKLQKQVRQLGREKAGLLREKNDLHKQIEDLGRSVSKLNKDKVNVEAQMEMEEENIVNRLQRQLDYVHVQYKNLERRMEERGLSLKDFGAEPLDVNCHPLGRHSFRSRSFDAGSLKLSRKGVRTLSGGASVSAR